MSLKKVELCIDLIHLREVGDLQSFSATVTVVTIRCSRTLYGHSFVIKAKVFSIHILSITFHYCYVLYVHCFKDANGYIISRINYSYLSKY